MSAHTPASFVQVSAERAERIAKILDKFGFSDDAQYVLDAAPMSTPDLQPALSASIALVRERDRYRAERDELLKALEAAVLMMDAMIHDEMPATVDLGVALYDARAAIAKVTK